MQFKPRLAREFKQAVRDRLARGFAARRFGKPLDALRRGPANDIDSLTRRIILPTLPVTDEEMARATHQDKGQKLARQELWRDLSCLIQYADDARLATPGGEAASALLAFGARSDVVAAAEDALYDGVEPGLDGIDALEEMYDENRGDYACALVVALAHIDIGWAWRDTTEFGEQAEHELRFLSHLRRARDLLAPFDGVDLDAPSLAAAQCAFVALDSEPGNKVADAYERLIDLDPDSPRHMRTLGQSLLPDRYGSYDQLELEARRTASRTGDIWGAGGYTWVYFDAAALDPGTLSILDDEFFTDGLQDIVLRKPDQHIVNLLAAFCAITMSPDMSGIRLSGSAEGTRARLHESFGWLVENHLQELHPLIWSQALLAPGSAQPLPSRRALVAKGRQAALRIIAERFADDISDGSSLAFSSSGMYRLPAL